MSDLPAFVIVDLPSATVALDSETAGRSVVVRVPNDAEIDAMTKAAEAGELDGIAAFYALAGLSVEQASALPETALDALVAGITQAIALVLHRRAVQALAYDPWS